MSTRHTFGVYVHIPFCQSKCRYCDFNSVAGAQRWVEPYLEALRAEMRATATNLPAGQARTLYLGGGTPSLLPAAAVERIIGDCRELFGLAAEAEVSLEANPGTVDREYLLRLRSAGVNRLSLGVQSFDPRMLAVLGRIHSAEQARQAFKAAREAGFSNVSLDLMYALPGQTMRAWEKDLEAAVALGPEHLSLYALSVEDDTPLAADVRSGAVAVPSADEAAEMKELAEDRLEAAGYVHYEISNWARKGKGDEPPPCCAHNLIYWRHEEYLGFGAGAHSFFGGERFRNHSLLQEYIRSVANSGSAVAEREPISASRAVGDRLMLGLRLSEGIDLRAFAQDLGEESFRRLLSAANEAVALGLAESDRQRLWLTRRGRLLANEVVIRLWSGLQAG